MDVGLEIRQAREQRGLTLQQVSRNTKIALHVLQAIEASDAARLPAHVFTRSFVKTYAQEVGLDPDSTTRRYLEQVEAPDAPEPAHRELDSPLGRQLEPWVPSRGRLLNGRFGRATVLIVIGITAMVLAVRGAKRGRPGETSQPGAPAVSAEVAAAQAGTPAVAGTSGTSDPPPTSGGSTTSLHLAIAPTGPCWVQATVNDQVVFATLLQPGDHRTVDAPSDVTLRVGDPAVFAFSINGKPARVPGVAGKAVTVHVRNENYSQFLVHQ
jgi:cytoskeletal protein RodZ